MSADNRSVTTDALHTLGTIISENEKRDAIHLAVEPVIAGSNMEPGTHVFLQDGKAHFRSSTGHPATVGIVDPFLERDVKVGDRFWLVVYPRQITSLRHVWEHPDFPASVDLAPAPQYGVSEQWIRNFADSVSLHYDVLMEGARDWVDSKKRGS